MMPKDIYYNLGDNYCWQLEHDVALVIQLDLYFSFTLCKFDTMRLLKLSAITSLLVLFTANQYCLAQYISRSEPIPFNCPTVCAGGKLILKVNQVENFSSGTIIYALLSNASGSFASGTTQLPSSRFSFNQGASWINGVYTFNGNVNNLYFEIQIPSSQAAGSNYSIRMISSVGYQSPDLFQCSGNNKITVTQGYTPLSSVSDTSWTTGQWIAHAYTWTSTTSAILNTPALIASQSFFNPANYKGHFLKNSLSFDINYGTGSAFMPGLAGVHHDGTSFTCGEGYTINYSLRMRRREYFNPGVYQFSIAGDDGIRLSIDGGNTWILDSFIEQSYGQSFKSTAAQYPSGICLTGNVDLVIEYFQRPVDSRVTFNAQLLSTPFNDPVGLSVCEGQQVQFNIGTSVGAQYQWQISNDGGFTFTDLSNTAPYSGADAANLNIANAAFNLSNVIFRCVITGICNNPLYSDTALLLVEPDAIFTKQPSNRKACIGETVSFEANAGLNVDYQWQISNDGGITFTNIANDPVFTGANSPVLSVNTYGINDSLIYFRCIANGCLTSKTTDVAQLSIGKADAEDFLPNVFTPNGDKVNDTFILKEEGLDLIEISIYNRWGQLVYSHSGPNVAWDGNYNGNSMPAGIYFYLLKTVLTCTNKPLELNGTIQLLR
jgi:gliding motility-associated-like protein